MNDPVRLVDSARYTLHQRVHNQAERRPNAIALLAPGRLPLTYGRLIRQMDEVVEALNLLGIGRNDRVAMVLPEGPEMAAAFIAVSAGATCAPLNPAYQVREFDYCLPDLNPKALLVAAGSGSPAIGVARALRIPILELSPVIEGEAGLFTLAGEPHPRVIQRGFALPDDALIALHTSGTGARPKLVPLTHRNICSSADNIRAAVELANNDRCLNVMPLFHIHGLSAVFASLAAGASIVCPPCFSPSEFFEWLAEFRPTWYTASPTIHQVILENTALHPEIVGNSTLRFIRSASSAMPRKVMADLERLMRAPFIEAYGMTEAAPQIASNRLSPLERRAGSVGRPAGPDVAIMNESGTPMPTGAAGEVVVRGANVMRAYENDPEATSTAFTRGWFRTGDLGRLDADGYLFITGRIKEVINRGGEKISPREVDEVLMDHPSVAQAVTFPAPHPTLGESVAAAVVLRGGASATETEIRQFAASRLAPFKLPHPILIVHEIPKSPAGKVQRMGLAEQLGLAGPGAEHSSVRPDTGFRTQIDERLTAILAAVLGLEQFGIHDNFFQCGGHSLMATQVTSRIRRDFHIELPVESLFERPTVAELGELIAEQQALKKSPSTAAIAAIPGSKTGDAFPLSFAQQRLWFLDQIEPGNPAYNMQAALRLTGVLSMAALEQSLSEILRRHQTLRTTFRSLGAKPAQIINPAKPFRLPVVDLSGLGATSREDEVQRLAVEEAGNPFHLARGPLFRSLVLRLGPEDHVLLLTMHHIVSDGWSIGVLYRDLGALYGSFLSGKATPLAELPIQYTDYSVWQREWLQTRVLQTHLDYWREQLANRSPALALPTDHARPVIQTYRGSRLQTQISPLLTEGLKSLGQREGATLFMVVLAAFQTLLMRYSGQEDILVGSPIAHRTHVETEELIGFFANTLVMRTDLSNDPSFLEALKRVRVTAMGAYAHQDLPFEKLVEDLQPERDPSYMPIFQVMFVFQNVPMQVPVLTPDLTVTPLHVDSGTAKFDLTLYLSETAEGLGGTWQYNSELFEAATIERMAGHFRTLLEGIIANPEKRLSELPLLSDFERRQLLSDCKPPKALSPGNHCFHHLFEEQVQRSPDALAVQCGEERLTYGALNARADQLARRLRGLGVGPETLVGICLTRSSGMVTALLGVLKAGGAYLPLDPEYPAERLSLMMDDARVPVIISEEPLRDRLPPHQAVVVWLEKNHEIVSGRRLENPVSQATAANLAYVIYTSGSTGTPKGVMITHANVCQYVHAIREALGITAADCWLHTASFAFSSSVRQFLVPLSCGATVIIATAGQIRDPRALFALIRQDQVSILDIVPWLWRACNQALARLEPTDRATLLDNQLRLILSASEPLLSDIPLRWAVEFRHGARLFNMLGHTETTGIVTLYPISAGGGDAAPAVPVGRPIGNTEVYLLGARQQLVPIGVRGEVYIGGAGVARGYLNRPELTAERFISDPFSQNPGARLYRTGDVARYLPDGNIEFLGRIDHQIKMRGLRIEPNEIETALAEHSAVRECAVVAVDSAGGKRLVAHVVLCEPGTRARLLPELRQFLEQKLPHYMVPAAIVEADALPRTPNGKVDRKALSVRSRAAAREPSPQQRLAEPPLVPERNPVEDVLAAIWAEVLNLDGVGMDDNFFDLGGDSILTTQIIQRANDAGLPLSLVDLFKHQTIGELARVAMNGALPTRRQEAAPVARDVVTSPVPPNYGTMASVTDPADPVVRVTLESLRAYGREALGRAGLMSEAAAIVTEVQLEASLRGQPTHNMGSIPRYAERIAAGTLNPQPRYRIVRETAMSALIDGDNGPGQWVGVLAMELAIRKARETGIGMVGARRSNHLGAVGHYAWLAAKENLIGLSTSNAILWLAPTGGLTPTFGNNPLGVAIPAGRRHPIVLDISMSIAAKGKIGLHLAEGKTLPPGWILDHFGRLSTDAADLAAGLGVPIGGHKGYGLALVMETLAGVLTGAGFCWDHRRERMRQSAEPPDLGHFFIAINPDLFMPVDEFTARVERMIDQVKTGKRAGNVEEVLVPGETEMRARERNLLEGVPLMPSTYRSLRNYREAAQLNTDLITVDGDF